MEYCISIILIAIAAELSCAAALPIFKILQLSGYKARGVFDYLKATKYDMLIRYAALMTMSFIAMVVFIGCFNAFETVRYTAVALYIILATVFIITTARRGDCKVVYTGRMIRIIVADTLLTLVLGACVAALSYFSPFWQTVTAAIGGLIPFVAIAANYIMFPFEKLNHGRYIKKAKAKLAEKSPIVIGITGSFGKTTAKNLLCGMLKEKYTVLATPGSFNTPMGICRTVNDGLADEQVLIAELGARHKGDIKELCAIVSPKYGIITAVGDMHIATFGSVDNVADTKFELAKSIGSDGFCAFNGYNARCAALFDRAVACEKTLVGGGAEGAIGYENLVIGKDGTAFELVIGGNKYAVRTALLGAHIAELVSVCAAVALKLGVTPEQIVSAVGKAEPVEHRLQLVPSRDPSIAVIDDAYNSNPVGAKNALDVLGMFGGKKIIITPGFVELGTVEKDCNTELGKHIAAVCDYAFLIGSRAQDIKSGAVDGGMNEGCISIFASLDDAVSALAEIVGDKAVLFENDLPDNIK